MLACTEDGQTIAVVNSDADVGPVVELYSYDGKLLHAIKVFSEKDKKDFSDADKLSGETIALHGERTLLAVGTNVGQVKLFDTATGKLAQSMNDNKKVRSLAFSPDGTLLFAGGKNDTSKICLLYTSPSPRDRTRSRMPSSA